MAGSPKKRARQSRRVEPAKPAYTQHADVEKARQWIAPEPGTQPSIAQSKETYRLACKWLDLLDAQEDEQKALDQWRARMLDATDRAQVTDGRLQPFSPSFIDGMRREMAERMGYPASRAEQWLRAYVAYENRREKAEKDRLEALTRNQARLSVRARVARQERRRTARARKLLRAYLRLLEWDDL